jgi:uncharacterized membrane protein YhiD involved in acid resistance
MENSSPQLPQDSERRQTKVLQTQGKTRSKQGIRPSRRAPFLRLFGFYALIAGIAAALVYYVPFIADAWSGQVEAVTQAGDVLSGRGGAPIAPAVADQRMIDRTIIMVLITLSALALSLPVAWIYTYTRRMRYDPSLVHSVIILPMVVAGIVVIVKDSVALAFSLAGIVAAVRFRNTLKDPKDAVYIFLALGIGLAAGVQAVDIAFVMSLLFNVVVLILWKWNLGAIYSGDQRDLLAIGDANLMIARNGGQRDAIRWRMSRETHGMETDGILLVHTQNSEAARQAVELSLSKTAEDYRIADNFRRRNGIDTFAVLLRLDDKKGDPLAILGELDDRWHDDVLAAEYIPFKRAAVEEEDAKA